MPASTKDGPISAQRKGGPADEDQEDVLVDLTAALNLHSKRTERLQKKSDKKREKLKISHPKALLDLPLEVFMEVINYLRPCDIFILARVSKSLNRFIMQEEAEIASSVISWRYPILEKCFRAPVLLESVDPAVHSILQSQERQEIQILKKKPYQHIRSPDPQVICTCLICILRWNALNLVIDFAHFQDNLDNGEPIPMIPRGKYPKWNQELTKANATIVGKALRSKLWYARILEIHLRSTVRAIRRHANNKGNQRRRFRMSEADSAAETDLFLARSGPPSIDFPFHRDNYYMLESYFPNRGWSSEEQKWLYMPASQHNTDVEIAVRWDAWRRGRQKTSTVASEVPTEIG